MDPKTSCVFVTTATGVDDSDSSYNELLRLIDVLLLVPASLDTIAAGSRG